MQPSADNGTTMAILKTCLPIPHLMSRTLILLEPWQPVQVQTRAGTIKISGSPLFFGKLIRWRFHAKPSVLCIQCGGVGKAKYLLGEYEWSRWFELIWAVNHGASRPGVSIRKYNIALCRQTSSCETHWQRLLSSSTEAKVCTNIH